MATDLRDLEADRLRIADLDCDLQTVGLSQDCQQEAIDIALAALDEIDRLKRLLICKDHTGCFSPFYDRPETFTTQANAWAAVRKAAMK